MNLLGIRAAPRSVTFAVYDSINNNIDNIEDLLIPNAFSIPDSLKFIRLNILDIIREFDILKAGIRVVENNSKMWNVQRIQIEGVIQEAFASSNLMAYYTGQSSAIASRCGFKSDKFVKYSNGLEDFEGVENWDKLSKEQREAVMCAIGAVNA